MGIRNDFVKDYEQSRPKMKQIVSKLENIWTETIEGKERTTYSAVVAVLTAVTSAAAAVIFMPFTRGVSLVLLGGAVGGALTAAGALAFNVTITDKTTLRKVKRLIEEFSETAEILTDSQTETRVIFEKPHSEPEEPVIRLSPLFRGLYQSLYLKSAFTLEHLLDVTVYCRTYLEQLDEFVISLRRD